MRRWSSSRRWQPPDCPPQAGALPPRLGWTRISSKHQSLWNPAAFGLGWGEPFASPVSRLPPEPLPAATRQLYKDPGALDPAVEQMETIKPFAEGKKKETNKVPCSLPTSQVSLIKRTPEYGYYKYCPILVSLRLGLNQSHSLSSPGGVGGNRDMDTF